MGSGWPQWNTVTVPMAPPKSTGSLPLPEYVLEHGDSFYTAATIGALDHGNLYGDPRFVAPAWGTAGNCDLQAGSPAINAGTAEGAPADDLAGRVRDARPDIGAYEYWVPVARIWLPVVLKGAPR